MLSTAKNNTSVPPSSVSRTRYLMGCLINITLSADFKTQAETVLEKAFQEIKRCETKLSRFLSDSEISRINQQAGTHPVEVDDELFSLLNFSVQLSAVTEGAFDISVGPLVALWEEAEKNNQQPSSQAIHMTLEKVGSDKIILNDQEKTIFFLHPEMQIDLGAIGKGYALDRAVSILRQLGVRFAVVDAGSTIYCLSDTSINFDIRHPRDPQKTFSAVRLKNQAVSTSANYERFYRINGSKAGHLMDPRQGMPVPTDILSASIVSSSSLLSDVLSTAVFILGPVRSEGLIRTLAGIEAVLVCQRHKWWPRLHIKRV